MSIQVDGVETVNPPADERWAVHVPLTAAPAVAGTSTSAARAQIRSRSRIEPD